MDFDANSLFSNRYVGKYFFYVIEKYSRKTNK